MMPRDARHLYDKVFFFIFQLRFHLNDVQYFSQRKNKLFALRKKKYSGTFIEKYMNKFCAGKYIAITYIYII